VIEKLINQHKSEAKRAEAEMTNAEEELEWRIKRFQEDTD
jgi:hypothetical protein